MVLFTEYGTTCEIFVLVVIIVIVALLTSCGFQRRKNSLQNKPNVLQRYSYDGPNGPIHWREKYRDGNDGAIQSPINISLCNAIAVPSDNERPLCFSDAYHVSPNEMSIYNDGNCVTLYAGFGCSQRPEVTGGPCGGDRYQFMNATFRWGPNDQEGSEHTIDYRSYAMELQAVHIKRGKFFHNLSQAAECGALLIISYIYEISPVDNPYLNSVTYALPQIQSPSRCVKIEPVPLFFFMPPFTSQYISYFGSLTYPPCTEGVQWIVQPKTLGVSSEQVSYFRRLCSGCGYIENNRRPVQNVNDRDILFHE